MCGFKTEKVRDGLGARWGGCGLEVCRCRVGSGKISPTRAGAGRV